MDDFFLKLFEKKYYPIYGKGAYSLGRTDVLSTRSVLDILERIPNDGTMVVVNEVLRDITDNNIGRIVLLGSGSGKLGDQLAAHFKKAQIIDIDINSSVIDRLTRKYINDPFRNPILGDARDLKLEEGSVDIVVAYSVLRYIKERKRVLDNIHRVLRHGGRAYIAEARIKKVITHASRILKERRIPVRYRVYKNQSFARVSFGYYLIHKSKTNKLLRQKLIEQSKKLKCGFVEAAFRSVGSYNGSLYTLCWTKRK